MTNEKAGKTALKITKILLAITFGASLIFTGSAFIGLYYDGFTELFFAKMFGGVAMNVMSILLNISIESNTK